MSIIQMPIKSVKHQAPVLKWAQKRGYPQLVLGNGTVIRHGLESWKQFVGRRNTSLMLLAWQRISQWNRLEQSV